MPESDELPALISIVTGSYRCLVGWSVRYRWWRWRLYCFLTIFCCQRLCLRQLANANGYFPAIALPVVVALKADELLGLRWR